MNASKIVLTAVAMLLAAGAVQADVLHMGSGLTSLETVPVGDAGNAADTRYDANGFGAVSYEYNIGKYEVTAGQYTEFLNKVAATDTYALYDTGMDITNDSWGCNIKRDRVVGQLHLQRGIGLGEPAGELRQLLGRVPVRQLAAQRPADWTAGFGDDRGWGVLPQRHR